jgi:FUN14 domain-containing protein 1
MSNIGNEAKGFVERLLGDVSKKSATKQVLIGASSGW